MECAYNLRRYGISITIAVIALTLTLSPLITRSAVTRPAKTDTRTITVTTEPSTPKRVLPERKQSPQESTKVDTEQPKSAMRKALDATVDTMKSLGTSIANAYNNLTGARKQQQTSGAIAGR